ncbi:MAG: hypothetical protein H7319_17610 [Spirosoma sp.]|nr:hypothetical protein [Spirosoma sp.]
MNMVNQLERDFVSTLENVEIIFGTHGSFRRWMPQNSKWKQQVSAPLFDAQMLSCYKKDKNLLQLNKDKILKDFKDLFEEDREFIDSIEFSTANSSRLLYRANKLNEIISKNL